MLNDDTKKRVCRQFISFIHVATRPLTLHFYLICILGSVFCTLVVILASGAFRFLSESVDLSLTAFKATAPLLLAIGFKILVLDYVLAVKTAFIYVAVEEAGNNPPPQKKLTKKDLLVAKGLLFGLDLVLSTGLTALLLTYAEHFQSIHADKVIHSDVLPKSIKAFFDEFHFVLKESIANAHYLLNGSLIFYVLFGFSRLVESSLHRIDMPQIQKNIFKLFGALAAIIVLISVSTYKVAAR